MDRRRWCSHKRSHQTGGSKHGPKWLIRVHLAGLVTSSFGWLVCLLVCVCASMIDPGSTSNIVDWQCTNIDSVLKEWVCVCRFVLGRMESRWFTKHCGIEQANHCTQINLDYGWNINDRCSGSCARADRFSRAQFPPNVCDTWPPQPTKKKGQQESRKVVDECCDACWVCVCVWREQSIGLIGMNINRTACLAFGVVGVGKGWSCWGRMNSCSIHFICSLF